MPAEMAQEATGHMNDRMKSCILRLYRSGVHVGEEWQADLVKIRAPGLVLWGAQDQSCPVRFADERQMIKFDTGHWFLLQAPAETAAALKHHWNSAGSM